MAKTVIIRGSNIYLTDINCCKIGHMFTILPSYAIYVLQMITFSDTAFFAYSQLVNSNQNSHSISHFLLCSAGLCVLEAN